MSLSEWIIDHTGKQTMLCLTCTIISSADLACYGIFGAKDWVSGDCGTGERYRMGCVPVWRDNP